MLALPQTDGVWSQPVKHRIKVKPWTFQFQDSQRQFQMDKGNYVGMVLIDLQKAFDTEDHSI